MSEATAGNDVVILSAEGELTAEVLMGLEEQAVASLNGKPRAILFDFTQARSMHPSGIGLFARLLRDDSWRGQVAVATRAEQIFESIQVANLTGAQGGSQTFRLFPTIESATGYFKRGV